MQVDLTPSRKFSWSERHPILSFLVIGIGGAALWIVCLVSFFYWIGGDRAVKIADPLIVWPAVCWMAGLSLGRRR